jgi:hypothetical protein
MWQVAGFFGTAAQANEVAEVCFSMLLGYMVQSALLDVLRPPPTPKDLLLCREPSNCVNGGRSAPLSVAGGKRASRHTAITSEKDFIQPIECSYVERRPSQAFAMAGSTFGRGKV